MGLLGRLVGKKMTDEVSIKLGIAENLKVAKEMIDKFEDLLDDIVGVVESGSLVYANGDMSGEQLKEFLQDEDADIKDTIADLVSFLEGLEDHLKTIQENSTMLDLRNEIKEYQKVIRHGYRLIRIMHIEYNMASTKFIGNQYYVVELEADTRGTVTDENSFKRMIHLSGDEQEVREDE